VKKSIRKWFLSIDRVSLFIVIGLVSIGTWFSITATPSIALRLNLPPYYFIKHHLLTIPVGLFVIFFLSFLQTKDIRKLSVIGYIICVLLLICVLFFGAEIKGAKRWLNVLSFSLQPSEFLKPILAITTAWFLSEQYRDKNFPGIILAILSLTIVIPLLLLQPDVGMTFVVIVTWIGQMFISGLSILMITFFGILFITSLFGLYFVLPHFAERINDFFSGGDEAYQAQKSIEAFKSGGFLGKGIGEGVIKTLVPDAHSDFIFSVIGEELGFLMCTVIIVAFVVLMIRSLLRVIDSNNMFIFISTFGIVLQIAIQVLVNIASSLNMIPTKGMTLPFISYGGSSFLATSVSIGFLLSITKNYGRDRDNVYVY
jgi:cell division protein FtsW